MQTTEFYSYYMKFADLGFALPSKKVQTQYNFPSSFMQMFIKSTLALQNAISRCFLTTVKLGNLHLFGLELQDDIRFFKFILTLRSCPPEKKKTKQNKKNSKAPVSSSRMNVSFCLCFKTSLRAKPFT